MVGGVVSRRQMTCRQRRLHRPRSALMTELRHPCRAAIHGLIASGSKRNCRPFHSRETTLESGGGIEMFDRPRFVSNRFAFSSIGACSDVM